MERATRLETGNGRNGERGKRETGETGNGVNGERENGKREKRGTGKTANGVTVIPFPVSRFPFQTGLERDSVLAARLETGNGETGNGRNGKTGNGTFGQGNGTFEKRENGKRGEVKAGIGIVI